VKKQIGYANVGYFHQNIKGVDFVFVDHGCYPKEGGIYADKHGPYGDNLVRGRLAPLGLPRAEKHTLGDASDSRHILCFYEENNM